jgi:hypothetical protein
VNNTVSRSIENNAVHGSCCSRAGCWLVLSAETPSCAVVYRHAVVATSRLRWLSLSKAAGSTTAALFGKRVQSVIQVASVLRRRGCGAAAIGLHATPCHYRHRRTMVYKKKHLAVEIFLSGSAPVDRRWFVEMLVDGRRRRGLRRNCAAQLTSGVREPPHWRVALAVRAVGASIWYS